MAVVAFARGGNQFAPIFEIERVAEIGLPDVAVFVSGLVGAPRA